MFQTMSSSTCGYYVNATGFGVRGQRSGLFCGLGPLPFSGSWGGREGGFLLHSVWGLRLTVRQEASIRVRITCT